MLFVTEYVGLLCWAQTPGGRESDGSLSWRDPHFQLKLSTSKLFVLNEN